MAQASKDIKVLVGIDGGASIDGKSGQLIANELSKLAMSISSKKAPQIALGVNTQLTSQNITKQLNEIIKGIKMVPIELSLQINQSSIEGVAQSSINFASLALEEYESTFIKSIQAMQKRFAGEFEQLSKTVSESGLITNTYETKSGLLEFLTNVLDTLNSISSLATNTSENLNTFSNKGWLKNLSDKRIYALLQSGGNTERADIFSKRLYGNTSKWFIAKAISSADNNVDGKILLIA